MQDGNQKSKGSKASALKIKIEKVSTPETELIVKPKIDITPQLEAIKWFNSLQGYSVSIALDRAGLVPQHRDYIHHSNGNERSAWFVLPNLIVESFNNADGSHTLRPIQDIKKYCFPTREIASPFNEANEAVKQSCFSGMYEQIVKSTFN